MNILQVYQVFNPYVASGAAKVAYDIARFLIKKGHKVVFYASDMEDWLTRGIYGDSIVDGIIVCRFKTLWPVLSSKFKIYFTPQLGAISGDGFQKFDIIHLHGYRSFQSVVIHHYAKKYGVPYILQAHGSLPRISAWRKLKWIYDALFGYRLLRDAARVIALNREEADQYRCMGVPEEKITIIPNGIDLSEYAELPPKGSFKKKFNIPEYRKIILYLGRIHKIKGIDFLVKAYSHLIKETNFKDAVLVIAGPDDGYLSEVKSLMHDLSVSNSVLFTGLLSEKDKIKACTDASIVAYLGPFEPYGLVSLEAAACETPVIVAQETPMAEIVNRGKFGFSVKYGDVISLASMLHRVLSDKELTENLGRNGRRYVFNNFDWSKITEKYEQVYGEVTNDKR